MSAAGVRGLRATYHRVLDKVELLLPEKLRPLYNHPAGNEPSGSHRDLPSCPFPLFTNPLTTLPVDSSPTTPTPVPQVNLCTFPCSLFFTFSFPTCLKLDFQDCALCDLCCTASLRHHSDPDQASWFDPSSFLQPRKGLGHQETSFSPLSFHE